MREKRRTSLYLSPEGVERLRKLADAMGIERGRGPSGPNVSGLVEAIGAWVYVYGAEAIAAVFKYVDAEGPDLFLDMIDIVRGNPAVNDE